MKPVQPQLEQLTASPSGRMCGLDLFHDPQFRILQGCHYRGVNVIRYRHAIVLETSQQKQNIFFVRALLDFKLDIVWQIHWLLQLADASCLICLTYNTKLYRIHDPRTYSPICSRSQTALVAHSVRWNTCMQRAKMFTPVA